MDIDEASRAAHADRVRADRNLRLAEILDRRIRRATGGWAIYRRETMYRREVRRLRVGAAAYELDARRHEESADLMRRPLVDAA